METIIMKEILKRMFHLFIKHDIVGPIGIYRYGHFGKNSILYKPAVTDRNKKLVSIGDNTTILSGARIQLYPQSSDAIPHIRIGNNCYIGYRISLLAGGNIDIGDGVLMASDILISSENHSMDPESELFYMDQPLICKDVSIGEGGWIGEKVCILPGVNIGKKCIIGAGSVVTTDIPDFCIASGSPAKVIKKYDFDLHKWIRAN